MELKEQTESRHPSEDKPWLFKPGQSGNPKGRPKGSKSLKQFAKDYLQSLPDDEKMEFMKGLDKKIIWEMAEGRPDTKTDVTSGGQPIGVVILPEIEIEHADTLETPTATDTGTEEQR